MILVSRREKIACAVVVTRIFDAVAQRLQAILIEFENKPKLPAGKVSEILDLIEKLCEHVDYVLAWKAAVFGPDFRSPQKHQIEELEKIKERLGPAIALLRGVKGGAAQAAEAGLTSAKKAIDVEWRSCLRNTSFTTVFRLGAPAWDIVRAGGKFLAPLVIPALMTGALMTAAYFYKAHVTTKKETRALLLEFNIRLQECKRNGDRILVLTPGTPEFKSVQEEISKIIEGGHRSNEPSIAQLNWIGVVAQLERHGVTQGAEDAMQAIGELKFHFLLRGGISGSTNAFSTNVFYPLFSKADAFLNANSRN